MNAREWAREYLRIAERIDESRNVSGQGLCGLLWTAEGDPALFPDMEEGRRWRFFCKDNFVNNESYTMIEDSCGEGTRDEYGSRDFEAVAVEAQQIRVLILCFSAAMAPWYMKRQRDLRRREVKRQLKCDRAAGETMAYGISPEEAILESGS